MTRTWTPDTDTPKPDGGVDYRTVKAWFQQCRDLAAAIEVQKQKIQRIRDVAEKCTQSLSGMPAGGGTGDKVGFAVEQLDTERRQLQRMETDLCNLRVEATRRAYCLIAEPECAEAICDHYVIGKSHKEIAKEVGVGGQMWSTGESNADAWLWPRYGTSFLTCKVYNMHKKTQHDFGRGQLFSSLQA